MCESECPDVSSSDSECLGLFGKPDEAGATTLLRREYRVSSLLNVMLLSSADGQSNHANQQGVSVSFQNGMRVWRRKSQPVGVGMTDGRVA